MKNHHVMVTTCDRAEPLLALLQDLARQPADVSVDILDDASREEPSRAREFARAMGWEWLPMTHRLGKDGYWMAINTLVAARRRARHFYIIQDDIRLSSRFFHHAEEAWAEAERLDPYVAAIQLLKTRACTEKPKWCDTIPERISPLLWRVGAVDLAAATYSSQALDIVGTIPPLFPKPDRGSGVGEYMSRILRQKGYSLFQTAHSLVRHRELLSVMHPLHRQREPIVEVDFIDDRDDTPAALLLPPISQPYQGDIPAALLLPPAPRR